MMDEPSCVLGPVGELTYVPGMTKRELFALILMHASGQRGEFIEPYDGFKEDGPTVLIKRIVNGSVRAADALIQGLKEELE